MTSTLDLRKHFGGNLDVAIPECVANDRTLHIPEGSWTYSGTGVSTLADSRLRMTGDGADSLITITSDAYLIDTPSILYEVNLEGFRVSGGKGAFRSTYAGTLANRYKRTFDHMIFHGYDECAVSANSSDMAHWHVTRSVFEAANANSTIGLALPSRLAGGSVRDCLFRHNQFHIKAAFGGSFLTIDSCGFARLDDGGVTATVRADIWVIPVDFAVVNKRGEGFNVVNNKFGNENQNNDTDYRILIAEEDDATGSFQGDKQPDMTSSTKSAWGHSIRENGFAGNSTGTPATFPIAYSTTDDIGALSWHSNVYIGSRPRALMEFESGNTAVTSERIMMFDCTDDTYYALSPGSSPPAPWKEWVRGTDLAGLTPA